MVQKRPFVFGGGVRAHGAPFAALVAIQEKAEGNVRELERGAGAGRECDKRGMKPDAMSAAGSGSEG